MRKKADLGLRLNRASPSRSPAGSDMGKPFCGTRAGRRQQEKNSGSARKPILTGTAGNTGKSGSAADPAGDAGLEEEEKGFGKTVKKMVFRAVQVLLLLFCAYMVFLIYGVVVTEYGYTEDGRIEPRIMTVEERRERRDFETVLSAYGHCRMLYEKILLLDYRMALGLEDPMTLAPEYEALLEAGYGLNVSSLVIRLDGMMVNPRYNRVKELMLSWGKNDAALYLQHMSAAITRNDAEAAGKALQDKDALYYDFSTLTQNIVTIGETISGMDMASVRAWSPSGYIEGQVGS